MNGLTELWARHLFESVSPSGMGFSRFHLTWEAGTVTVSGDSQGARKLREWIYGDKQHSKADYVAEADGDLLKHIATLHAGCLEQPNPTERICAAATEAADRTAFLKRLT